MTTPPGLLFVVTIAAECEALATIKLITETNTAQDPEIARLLRGSILCGQSLRAGGYRARVTYHEGARP